MNKRAHEKTINYNQIFKNIIISKGKWIILLICIIIIQYPKLPYIQGNDGYEILWMANALAFKTENTWLVNIFSYFGFYPFSFYPVGYPYMISLFIKLGWQYKDIAFFFSLIFSIIAMFSSYLLSSLWFKKDLERFFFVLCYTISPMFLRYTYMSFSARGPFIAIAPFFLYFLYKTEKKTKDYILLVLVLIISSLTHRIWVVFIPIVVFYLISSAIIKKKKAEKLLNNIVSNKKLFFGVTIIFLIVLIYLGSLVFDLNTRSSISPWFTNSNILGIFMNLIIDYGFRLGLISVFFPYGIYVVLKEVREFQVIKNKNKKISILNNYFLSFFLFFVFINSMYNILAFLPFFIQFSIKGLFTIRDNKYRRLIVSMAIAIFNIIIITLYNFFNVKITYYLIVLLFANLVLVVVYLIIYYVNKETNIMRLLIQKKKLNKFISILLLINFLLFSFISMTGLFLNNDTFPEAYLSNEIVDTANYICALDLKGSILVYHPEIARGISGYAFIPTINGYHSPHILYYNYVNHESIQNNYSFNLFNLLFGPDYNYLGEDYEQTMINTIENLNVTNMQDLNRLNELNIQFALVLKNQINNTVIPLLYSHWGNYYYPFFESLKTLNPIFTSQHLMLFQFF